jgi:hypothetical protein
LEKNILFKLLITLELRIGKFPNWAEMKVNYPTNKENTLLDFSDNFHKIKNFVQVDHFQNISKNLVIISFSPLQKNAGGRKFFPITKNECIQVSDYCDKISEKSDHHALLNISSNPTVNISGTDNSRVFGLDSIISN